MKILIAGSSGMIGSAATRHLLAGGHDVTRLVRHTPGPSEVWWDPDAGKIDAASLDGFDGVVHLATKPWPMRWTHSAQQTMLANRLGTNRLLADSLAGCAHRPRVLMCASGMGYYPSSGDDVLSEDCPAGASFLATLQRDGEAATAPATQAGIRVVHLRIPPVIGGATLLRTPFPSGSGQQWVSWIGRDELASIIEFALATESLSGAVNAVSPNPMHNADFVRALAQALGRRPGGRMPTPVIRLV
ncbi:MAG TPA: NAD-dependent epimerase/dehydratase family protein, partial [Anaerolineales bacterium]|nr:NAD-dependent epimerase/dehydratase family protein [Anaerolineales bacterium]